MPRILPLEKKGEEQREGERGRREERAAPGLGEEREERVGERYLSPLTLVLKD